MTVFRPTEPIRMHIANGGYGASGRVPAAKAERPLSVQSRDLRGVAANGRGASTAGRA
jgi:hypothetical protein